MLHKLDILRDCWWVLPSGESYVTDENDNFSSYTHGLHSSLNTNDTEYIKFHGGSGIYTYRVSSSNIDVNQVILDTRLKTQEPSATTKLIINGIELGNFGTWTYDNIVDDHHIFNLTNEQKERILLGRTNANYDYAEIRVENSGIISGSGLYLYNLEIAYSGVNDWNNYQTGLPNINTKSFYPTRLSYRDSAAWSGDASDIDDSPGLSADVDYIEKTNPGRYTTSWTDAQAMPNGDLSLYFDHISSGIDPLTTVTRAQMKLRFALPNAITAENSPDAFEINGYNHKYKNQDYLEDGDLQYIQSSKQPLDSKYGYYLYGVGSGIKNTSFVTYTSELNFLDPLRPSGLIPSIKHANVDMLANMEFQLVGIPSGAKLSAAELTVEYKTDDHLNLYIAGDVKRCAASSTIDHGTYWSYDFGDGGWHHRGWKLFGPTVIEEEIFDHFYSFSEASGTKTYPETANTYYFDGNYAATVYGEYVLNAPSGTTGDDGNVTPLLKEPIRKEYYRNPVGSGEFDINLAAPLSIDAIKPTYYRHMLFHGESMAKSILNLNSQFQVYFGDRLGLTTDFTLYFMLYRTYGENNYGRFFHRGLTLKDGVSNYEIYGDIEPGLVRFTVQDSAGNDNQVEVEIDDNTKEPILIWFGCGYEADDSGFTTITLNVHDKIQNYFGRNWKRAQKQFRGYRKQYTASNVRTVLGTLERLNYTQQSSRKLYLNHVSLCEFGYANEYIDLNWELTDYDTYFRYDIDDDKDKKFFQTRISTNRYLQYNPSGVNWVVPYGSGGAEWSTTYLSDLWTMGNTPHSLFNPITTAGTNNIVAPSAIHIDLNAAHATNHPSGMQLLIDVEFDSGASDKWKVAHMELNIPSGGGTRTAYAPIDYKTFIQKHINMDEGVIKYSDVERINVTVTTKYHDIEEQKYYGNFTLHSMRIFFDSYCVAATGLQYLTLYTYGSPTKIPEHPDDGSMDLYILGHMDNTSDSNNLDLYIYGRPHIASGNFLSLYTIADHYSHDTKMNLFIEGYDPPNDSGNMPLYMWATPAGVGGIRESTSLYINSTLDPKWMVPLYITAGNGSINSSINLFLGNYPEENSNDLTLYVNGPSGTNDNINLYINGYGTTEGAYPYNSRMPLFIARDSEAVASRLSLYLAQNDTPSQISLYINGAGNSGESIPLYIYGSGAPPSNNLELYTHGF